MSLVFRWYTRLLNKHPWKVQLFTTGFLMGSSDVIAQTAIEKCKIQEIELRRVGRFVFLGTFFVAPVIRTWYIALERIVGNVGKTVGLRKMMVDQLLFTPCFLASFLTVSGLVQLQQWKSIKTKLQNDYFSILKKNYMIWPTAQLITFYIIPLQMRIIFVSLVALVWNTYLASQANKSLK